MNLSGCKPKAIIGKATGNSDRRQYEHRNTNTPLDRLRERWSDPLLTRLTVLLVLMMFVFAPLQAIGIKLFQVLGLVSALVIIGGISPMSGSPTVVVALLAAFIVAGTAAVSRINSPSRYVWDIVNAPQNFRCARSWSEIAS